MVGRVCHCYRNGVVEVQSIDEKYNIILSNLYSLKYLSLSNIGHVNTMDELESYKKRICDEHIEIKDMIDGRKYTESQTACIIA